MNEILVIMDLRLMIESTENKKAELKSREGLEIQLPEKG